VHPEDAEAHYREGKAHDGHCSGGIVTGLSRTGSTGCAASNNWGGFPEQSRSTRRGALRSASIAVPACLFQRARRHRGCFDEESQSMLECSSEPALCAIFTPTNQVEVRNALRSLNDLFGSMRSSLRS